MGALVAAIPLTALTQGMRRRPLLLSAICGFAIVNLVTALSHDYHVSLATRFFAGVFGGIVWSLLAGYAVRMSPAHLGGRAIAISGAGATRRWCSAYRSARCLAEPSAGRAPLA